MRVIVAISGGKASAWCAGWALRNYPKSDVVFYFNDTKWEHPDLYRFLDELSNYYSHPIVYDSDGRSPEELFYDERCLANNRIPFCSKILKAKRLQKFYADGDHIVFGIGAEEPQRADRLIGVYQTTAVKTGKYPVIHFPLISESVTRKDIDAWLKSTGINEPYLYKLGFTHNNCSGGCVRAGLAHWKRLYEKLPEIYCDRERVEREFNERFNSNNTILKGISLTTLRRYLEMATQLDLFDDDVYIGECFGICDTTA